MSNDRLFDPGPETPPTLDFHVGVAVKSSLRFDLKRFIFNRLDEYLEFTVDLSMGYHWWEKPLVFINEWIDNETSSLYYASAYNDMHEHTGELDYDFPRWLEEQTVQLHEDLCINKEGTERCE